MIGVGAAARDQRNLRAGRTAGVRIRVGGDYAELLHRVAGGTQHTAEGIAGVLVVIVNAVKSDVALV